MLNVIKGISKLALLFVVIVPLATIDIIFILGGINNNFPCVNFFINI